MNTLPHEQLTGSLRWRYATKQFDPSRKISSTDWTALEDALQLTASSLGLQPWRIVVVTNAEIRRKLIDFSWGQKQITDASHLVVFAARTNLGAADIEAYMNRIATVRGVTRQSLAGFESMVTGSVIQGMDASARTQWATRQAYIALGNFLTSAALLGIDACPMEGFQAAQYDEILGLTAKGLTAVVLATAGYRLQSDPSATLKKVRLPKEELFLRI
jgi:nitroreductase